MFNTIKTIFERDPAARGLEIILYQGLWAMFFHRIAHLLYQWHIPFFPRLISQFSRFFTFIEIHPGATIGKNFFIDHGAGVVIGETTVIGDNVTIYQGVTLGGTGKEKGKRHPTVENDVVIGAGAIVLGNITIGENARVGAGAVITKSVPANSTVVGNPAWTVRRDGKRLDPLEHGALPDPVHQVIEELNRKVEALEKRVSDLAEGRMDV